MLNKPIAIDLFAGAGGLTLGFEMAGFSVKGSIELDDHACDAHKKNFPDCRVIKKDITSLNGNEILKELKIAGEQVDVVIGGPPCQGFSLAGKRASDDIRNELLNEYARIVLEILPRFFVMENVKGLLSYKSGDVLDQFINLLCESYNIVKPLKVLNAADFGVPQNRERLFVLGSRKDIDCKLEYPQPTHISPKSATYKYDPVNKNHSSRDEVGGMRYCPTVADAIGDLPNPELFKELIEQDSIPYTNNVKYISEFAKIMRGQTVVLDDYSTIPPNWDSRIITNFKRTKHDDRIKKEFQVLKEGEAHHSRRRKLSAKGLSPTIRAGTKSDKGSYTALRPIHYEQPRVITVREAARLMSFPDWMYFHHTKWHGFRLVGNAVPPLLAKAVALQVRREILKIKELEVTQNAKA